MDRLAIFDREGVYIRLGQEDRRRIEAWNATGSEANADQSVHGLFSRIAARHPHAIAVRQGDSALSYGGLEERSDALAAHLRELGAGQGRVVVICMERSLDSVVALLAVLKTGACYLPLDPGHPARRLAFMWSDAGAELALTDAACAGLLQEFPGQVVRLDRLAHEPGSPDRDPVPSSDDPRALAYVMYTSGSTGRPKAVGIRHRSIIRLVTDVDYVELGAQHTILHAAPLAFDASTFEVWGALLTGATLVVLGESVVSPERLEAVIERYGVTTLFLTTALFNTVVDESPRALRSLKQLLTGGEALSVPHVRRALAQLESTRILNCYGPTESTTFTTTYEIPRELPAELNSIPIGRPIRDTQLHVFDEERRLVPIGGEGELYIGGEGLACGYLGRPELTAERFLPDPFSASPDRRLFRTGDRVRLRPDGALDFLGRLDDQVKIRGFRIELGEVEAALRTHPGVRDCAVVPLSHGDGSRALHACCVPAPGVRPSVGALRGHLAGRLPDPMLPRSFRWVEELPLTRNGKIDRRALPGPTGERPELSSPYREPRSQRERSFCAAWEEVLEIGPIGIRDNFFELGGDSLLALRAVALLRESHGIEIEVTEIFETPTIEGLCNGEARGFESQRRRRGRVLEGRGRHQDVAVIGMAGRFPGAGSVATLWRNLCDAVESITFFEPDQLDAGIDPALRADPDYVAARGILADADLFDAAFFGMSPLAAQVTDPQQRVLLELAWETLENAGYVPERFRGSIGVFAGKYNNSYFAELSARRPDLIDRIGAFQAMLANEKDYVATRIAHELDLTGPAVSVHTACSTSLVAICQAVQNLRLGQCDMALAGGASITVPVASGYLHQEGGMLSPDGRCRPFDEAAAGTTFGDGAAMVLLKRLEDARADGDTIYAVVRGCAVNNDGAGKASFTAPSVTGQATAVATAHLDSGVEPGSIRYVETHGTATPVGDPIEVEALKRAFGATPEQGRFCAIGSLKSNFGHLVVAAGVAGFIKTALSLQQGRVPPTLHFKEPNPLLGLEDSPFFVNSEILELPPGAGPLRAGVSSFGVGGTNAHVVLEEAPVPEPRAGAEEPELLLLSARSESALERMRGRLAAHLSEHPELRLADVARTLQEGRRRFDHRELRVCSDVDDARRQLLEAPRRAQQGHLSSRVPPLVFMFPGQGSQVVGMGRTLYERDAAFRRRIDEATEILRPTLGDALAELLYPREPSEGSAERLRQTRYTQPALFAVEFALAERLLAWGLDPEAMIGHSVGDFVAAALAGVWSFEEGLELVAQRGRLLQELPAGSMLSVPLPAEELTELLDSGDFGDVGLAAENGPRLCVASGPTPETEALLGRLEAMELPARILHTSHAFHSSMMQPAVDPLRRTLEGTTLRPPSRRFVSTVTGCWITEAQAMDPAFWAGQLRQPVRFARGIETLLDTERLFVEVGPRDTLSTLAMQQLQGADKRRSVAMMAAAGSSGERQSILTGLGQLWLFGHEPRWDRCGSRAGRVPLPTYPFERQRYWIDPIPAEAGATGPPVASESVAEEPTEVRGPAEAPAETAPAPPEPDLLEGLKELFEEVSGEEPESTEASFLELGVDSLLLTQLTVKLGQRYGVRLRFRQLMEDYVSLDALARFLESQRSAAPAPVPAGTAAAPVPAASEAAPRAFGAGVRIGSERGQLDARQQQALAELVDAYTRRTRRSKEHAQENRAQLADPRVVTGFKPDKKELVYPIVAERSRGSRLWDLDGNEYVDALNGFGSNFFGHGADFIREAIKAQVDLGYQIGPQTPLAAECAALVCELTGAERAAFCNTGSEAVLGCMRVARTVTGRPLIVSFSNDYHGIFDEVIVRGTAKLRSLPAAAGITPESVANTLILDYSSDSALRIIRERSDEIAAVLVEPVQSRRPDLQPAEFLRALRELTSERGSALIFDEVITGFRVAPGGAQEHFDVRADVASYGKVPGGGMPMGIIAGKREWMDALDGGSWSFGDDSKPEAGVTYFAGTFVRHPLALAAVRAGLSYLREQGPGLQQKLSRRTARLADEINRYCDQVGAPLRIHHFSSMWRVVFDQELPHSDLLCVHLRQRGVHIWDGFPCFLSIAHSEADVDFIVRAFRSSIRQMMNDTFLPERPQQRSRANLDVGSAPVEGARLGRDERGNPAWYAPDPECPGRWIRVEP